MKARRSGKREPSHPGSAAVALQRLRELEERHEIAMGAINEAVYDWNISDDSVYFAGDMERVLSLAPGTLKSESFRDWHPLIHPDDFPRFREATIAHLKGATERFACDYRYRALDGTWHWARTHGLAVRDKRGRAIRMIGSTGDITELKASEERYALATSAAVEGIYEWDIPTGKLFLSDRAKEFFSLPAEKLTPAAWNQRIHGEDFPGYQAAILAHFKGSASHVELEYRIADGRGGYRWVLDRGIGVRDANGRVTKLVGALSDITPRKRAEIELRRARDQAEEALEQQTATAEILKATLSSPTDVQQVFQAILANASRLCEASCAAVFLYDGASLRNVAHQNASAEFAQVLQRMHAGPSRETTTRRCALERRTIHTADLLNDPEFSPPESHRRENVRTALSVPMLREGALVGVITLWRTEVRPFTDRQIALVETFADQAVIAIENTRLFNETKEALERQTATSEVLRVISSSPNDLQAVFDAILENATRICDAHFGTLQLYDGTQFHAHALHKVPPAFAEALRREPRRADPMTGMGRLVATKRAVHIHDVAAEPAYAMREPMRVQSVELGGVRTALVVPLLKGEELLGGLQICRQEVRPFTEKQIGLVCTFADQAVIAIENARLFNETREALEQQTATAEILNVISRSPTDTQPVFEAIVRSGVRLFPGAAVAVALPRDGQVRVAAIAEADAGRAASWRARFPFPLTHEYMHGAAILEGRLVDVPDARNAPPGLEAGCRNFLASGYRAATIVPLMRGGSAIGALSVLRLVPGLLGDKQLALLRTFADQAVIAIENARLFNELQARNRELTEALEQQTATGEILRVISSSPTDLAPVFDAVANSVSRLCDAPDVVIVRAEGGAMRFAASVGPFGQTFGPDLTVPIARGSVAGRAVLERKTIQVDDLAAETEDEYPEGKSLQRRYGHRTMVAAPLLLGNAALGAIAMLRKEVRPFSDKQLALLQTFADQAVIAIQNVRLFNETREALEQQKASGEVLAAISSSIADARPVFDKILESCQRLFAGRIVGLNLLGEDGKLHIGAYQGAHRGEFERIFPLPATPESGSGLSIVERRVVHYPDAENGEDVPERTRQGCRAIGIKSVIFAPLLWEGRGVGAIFVGRDHVSSFSEKEIALLKTFADQAVIGIQNARLFQEIQDKSRQIGIANRHKSEFLANMSHELRTPLNAIIGFTRIVRRNAQERLEPKQLENLDKILASGEHLLALINAILDLSKVEAGRVEVNPAEIALAPVLEQCLRTVEPLVKSDAVMLVKKFDGGLPQMYADEEKLRQIVINLLSNAAKFTAHGSIRLEARAANGSVAIAVADTGIGIAADKLDVIFEEFEQADASSTRVHGGTGLGLTIARRLARLMGGDIRAESTPGSGSTFTLTLPVRYSA